MDLEHGLLLGFIGCTVTFVGFFIVFLTINYNKKKELKKLKDIEDGKKGPLPDIWTRQIYSMKIKKSEYQDYADCIRSDQVSAAGVMDLFKDKEFYKWYKKKYL